MAQFPSKEIAQRSYDFRTLGLGFANLGGLLMASGVGYDSDEGRNLCASISALMTGIAYETSAEIASEMGAFPGYKKNSDDMLRVIRNHKRAAFGENTDYEGLSIYPVPLTPKDAQSKKVTKAAKKAWDKALKPVSYTHLTLPPIYSV